MSRSQGAMVAPLEKALQNGAPRLGVARIVSVDPAGARRSVEKLADLDLEIVCQSHGEPVLHGGAAAIGKALAARS